MRSVLDEESRGGRPGVRHEGRALPVPRTEAMESFAKVCPRCGMRFDAAASFCQKDGAALRFAEEDTDPRIGQVLLDQFRIEERIGAGGMGSVYRARQTSLGRDVAIKILHPDLARNPDAVRRFQREARISTALDHPNVVRVFLFGQLPDGSLYLVMELLRGRTLAELARVEVPLPVHRALHIATQACDGVGEAHAQGIVHRDVKPENIFLISKGRDPDFVKVLDFGIARVLRGDDATQATQSGLVFGTARYISPEGAAGERTDARSDVYSLGVVTYQLLCGETPFDASSPVTLLMKHIHDPVPHLKSRRGGAQVPDAVADVVMRALAKNPEARYDDAHELAEVLRMAAQRAGLDVVRMRSGSASMSSLGGERRDPSGPMIRERAPAATVAIRGGASSSSSSGSLSSGSLSSGSLSSGSLSSGSLSSGSLSSGSLSSGSLSGAPDPFGGGMTGEVVIPGLPGGRGKRARSGAATVAIAFLVGALAVGGGAWAVHAVTAPDPVAVEAEDLTRRAGAALSEGHLDEASTGASAGENVRALTDRLLALRAGDPEATRLRRAAADRLLEEAEEAEREARHADALDRYRRALALVSSDSRASEGAARMEIELARPPRVAGIAIAPEAPFAGDPALLTATIPEGALVEASDRPRFVVRRGTQRVSASIDAVAGRDPGTWVATYTFTSTGRFSIKFVSSSNDDEDRVELQGDVEVARAPRATRPRQPEPPPITTQGTWVPANPVPAIVDVPPPPTQGPQLAAQTQPALTPPVMASPPPPIFPLAPAAPTQNPAPPPPPWTSD